MDKNRDHDFTYAARIQMDTANLGGGAASDLPWRETAGRVQKRMRKEWDGMLHDKEFAGEDLETGTKDGALDWGPTDVKRIDGYAEEEVLALCEKGLAGVLLARTHRVIPVVHKEETLPAGGHLGDDTPRGDAVHETQVSLRRRPHQSPGHGWGFLGCCADAGSGVCSIGHRLPCR